MCDALEHALHLAQLAACRLRKRDGAGDREALAAATAATGALRWRTAAARDRSARSTCFRCVS